MEHVELTTDRLLLRPPSESDVDQISELCQDSAIVEYTRIPWPYGRSDASAFVNDVVPGNWLTGSALSWGVFPKMGGGPLMGIISIMDIRAGGADLGYWLGSSYRGRGFMAEATGRVIAFAFAEPPHGLALRRLSWEALESNAPSARIAQNAGFRWEGVRRAAEVRNGQVYNLVIAGLLRTDDPTTATPWPTPSN
jgi:RimJ/RimL family protein N-acetyltransferase